MYVCFRITRLKKKKKDIMKVKNNLYLFINENLHRIGKPLQNQTVG
jgi:hypothetical protein